MTFTYAPADLYTGFWIYLAGMALLVLYGVFLAVRAWRPRPREPVTA